MALRRQFVLDKKSDKLLKRLAADRGGNRSRVVREALESLAQREDYFDRIESDPAFLMMMEKSQRDIRAGRVSTLDEVERRLKSRATRRKAS
jgi:predicted transcriptional regulator